MQPVMPPARWLEPRNSRVTYTVAAANIGHCFAIGPPGHRLLDLERR